jgi:hypothetical protein
MHTATTGTIAIDNFIADIPISAQAHRALVVLSALAHLHTEVLLGGI